MEISNSYEIRGFQNVSSYIWFCFFKNNNCSTRKQSLEVPTSLRNLFMMASSLIFLLALKRTSCKKLYALWKPSSPSKLMHSLRSKQVVNQYVYSAKKNDWIRSRWSGKIFVNYQGVQGQNFIKFQGNFNINHRGINTHLKVEGHG